MQEIMMNIFQDFRSVGECLRKKRKKERKMEERKKERDGRHKARGKCISFHIGHCGESGWWGCLKKKSRRLFKYFSLK